MPANAGVPPSNAAAILSSNDAPIMPRAAAFLPGLKESRRRIATPKGATTRIARRIPSTPQLQRLGDTSKIPAGLSCSVALSGVPAAEDSILFPNANAALTPSQRLQVENFVLNWTADGASQRVRVDGFASTPGNDELNWRLSCRRAEAVAAELEHPSSAARGIPPSMISVFMQGETSEFGAEPDNRRVTLSFPARPAPPAPTPRARSCGPDAMKERAS